MDNIRNFSDIILYTKDRIHCIGMCGGKFEEEINVIVKNVKEYLKTHNEYNPLLDLDNDGNSPMHLIVKNGFYELFFIFKDSVYFDHLKNMKNKKGETPLDLVELRGDDIYLLLKPDEYVNNISVMMTDRYYSKSFEKLEKIMKECGFVNEIGYKNVLISRINELIENITNKENIKKHAEDKILMENEMKKLFFKINNPEKILENNSKEVLEEKIYQVTQKIQPYIYRLNLLLNEINSLTSDEIKNLISNIKHSFYQVLGNL